ncbi:Glycosyltransferase [Hyella patelloides LEGE 07179]|uniref:Glycosyltransferase n=1 Tax=Hyella patelloides LEGE 07179 TaxID=945734 RepID=A0A563VLM1_9CYAN|nr:glycosyltransferase family 4 protein [Hyella patelloides]VEP12223.1 Glycosyltransferase [Hyella patelloides LEGE 07179]
MFKLSDVWATQIKNVYIDTTIQDKDLQIAKEYDFRLSIITQFYPPDYAATGQLIQELATQLEDNNIEVNVFTGQPGYAFSEENAPPKEKVKGVTIKRSRASRMWSGRITGKAINGIIFCLRTALHIVRHRKRNDVLLITTAPPFLSVVGYLTNLFFGVSYVCLVYDLYPDVATEFGLISDNHPIAKFWNWVNGKVWRRAKSIIVLSETMKNRITAKHPDTDSKIAIIHNWANADWIKPLAKQQNWFACEHGIDRKFTVLYSGNLGRCHDVDTILGTIKLLKNEPIQFVFIGAGAKHDICRQTVADWGFDNCSFLPYQDRKNLPYSLTACDLALVSIAPGMEGIVAPSKLYGVMAAGRAIAAICEPHSYLRELLAEAGCGGCFNNQDSYGLANFIRYLADNPHLSVDMGASGRQYLETNFTPQIIAQKYHQVLNPNASEVKSHAVSNQELEISS